MSVRPQANPCGSVFFSRKGGWKGGPVKATLEPTEQKVASSNPVAPPNSTIITFVFWLRWEVTGLNPVGQGQRLFEDKLFN
jgi:hypothetical protein